MSKEAERVRLNDLCQIHQPSQFDGQPSGRRRTAMIWSPAFADAMQVADRADPAHPRGDARHFPGTPGSPTQNRLEAAKFGHVESPSATLPSSPSSIVIFRVTFNPRHRIDHDSLAHEDGLEESGILSLAGMTAGRYLIFSPEFDVPRPRGAGSPASKLLQHRMRMRGAGGEAAR